MSYHLTLSETETCLRKAARACGLDWGIAEEAGKAARWLAAFDLPGPEAMLAHLQELRGFDYRHFIPDCEQEPWQASGGLLCPVITGAALADRSAGMLDGHAFKLGRTAHPLLLAATLGQAARRHDTAFVTCWPGVRVDCFGHGLSISGSREDLLAAAADHVCCCQENGLQPQLQASTMAYEIDPQVFRQIDEMAFETYVPATDASRAGAGTGSTQTDND